MQAYQYFCTSCSYKSQSNSDTFIHASEHLKKHKTNTYKCQDNKYNPLTKLLSCCLENNSKRTEK